MKPDDYYKSLSPVGKFAHRLASALLVVIMMTGLAKLLSWGLSTDFTDMFLVLFVLSFFLREM
jgi:hypothetical protein